jgi:DNA polymerase-3 subunit gamma/tau
MTMLRMLAFRPAEASAAAPASGGSGAAKKPSQKAAPAAVAKVVQAQAGSTESVAKWQEPNWVELVAELGLAGADRLLASSCAFLKREGNTVFFSLDPGSESYLTRQRKESLATALSRHFEETLTVDISIGEAETESPMQAESRQADERFEAERAKLESDPNVKALKDMFGAELNADSIKLNNPPQGE